MPPMFLIRSSKEVISMQMMFWRFAMLFISTANMLMNTQKMRISLLGIRREDECLDSGF